MMNDNNTGPGIAGEPEPAVPPEAEQTSVSLPSFIAPFLSEVVIAEMK